MTETSAGPSAGRPLDASKTSTRRGGDRERDREDKTPSSLGMALDAERAPRARLAAVIGAMRPDWRLADVVAAVNSDDRPFRVVAMAHITAAADPTTVSPNRGRTIPWAGHPGAQPLPTVADALNPQLDDHGFEVGRCPICRRGGRP